MVITLQNPDLKELSGEALKKKVDEATAIIKTAYWFLCDIIHFSCLNVNPFG